MKNFTLFLICLLVLAAVVPPAVSAPTSAAPTITGLTPTTLAQAGRLRIRGSGFGATQGTSVVEIGGVASPVSRWTDTAITAYVPDATNPGPNDVQVITPQGASNTVTLEVNLRQADGRVLWRFQADGLYIAGRPAVGSDGSVYVADVGGILYGLEADGGVKWIFRGQRNTYGPVAIGLDEAENESVYFAAGSTIYALDPADCSPKWSFTDPNSSRTIAGQNVGPDNNVYAVSDGTNALGMLSLSPAGALRWNTLVSILDEGSFGLELMFSPTGQRRPQVYYAASAQAGGRTDGRYFLSFEQENGEQVFAQSAFDQAWVAPAGVVWVRTMNGQITAYNADGQVVRRINGAVYPGPVVGPDNVIYVGQGISNLAARRPDGRRKWVFAGTGILDDPAVQPQNTMVVFGGYVIANPGYVQAVGTGDGQPLWNVVLPFENGSHIWPFARPQFSADGKVVYVGMTGNNYAADPYTYLYAIQTAP